MICPHCNNNLPDGLIICFLCGKSLREPLASSAEQEGSCEPLSQSRKKKGFHGIIVAVVIFLLLGGAVGGHFLGLYSLPMLPERTETGDAPSQELIDDPANPPADRPTSSISDDPVDTADPAGPTLTDVINEDGNRVVSFGETDSQGNKTGFWIENVLNAETGELIWLHEGYYVDGVINGESKHFWFNSSSMEYGLTSGTHIDGLQNGFSSIEVFLGFEKNNDPSAELIRFGDLTGSDLIYAYRGILVNGALEDTTGTAYQLWREADGSFIEYIGEFRNDNRNGMGRVWNTARGWEFSGLFVDGWIEEPGRTSDQRPESTHIPDGTYFIVGRASNFFLDVEWGSHDNGARIWLFERNDSTAQQWRFARQTNGAYKISAVHSGRLIEVRNGLHEPGAEVAQWDDANHATQQWFIYDVGGGFLEFVNSNSGLALDAPDIDQQTYLTQSVRNRSLGQQFSLIRVPHQIPDPTPLPTPTPSPGQTQTTTLTGTYIVEYAVRGSPYIRFQSDGTYRFEPNIQSDMGFFRGQYTISGDIVTCDVSWMSSDQLRSYFGDNHSNPDSVRFRIDGNNLVYIEDFYIGIVRSGVVFNLET